VDRIGSEYQGAVEEALNRLGCSLWTRRLPPARVSIPSRAGPGPAAGPRPRDRGEHLSSWTRGCARAGNRCRESKQRVGDGGFLEAGLEIRRASDGQPLLVTLARPSRRGRRGLRTGQVTRRKSMDVMIEESVDAVLAPFGA